MSEGMLSQDEINALFNQTESTKKLSIEDFMTPMEQDALGEIGNISLGSSTTALSTLLNQRVEITTPTLSIIEHNRIEEEFPNPHVAVNVDYTIGFRGKNLLVIRENDAKIIANLMMGGDGSQLEPELSELHLSAVQEAMNQMMGSAATSMSTMFNQKVDISPPSIKVMDFHEEKLDNFEDEILIKVSFRLKVGDLIDSNMMQLIPLTFGKEMIQQILAPESPAPVAESVPQPQQPAAVPSPAPMAQPMPSYSAEPVAASHVYGGGMPPVTNHANVQKVEFSSFAQEPAATSQPGNLNLLFDVPLGITVELGRTEMEIRKILELGPGSIIELDKLAGEPVDIFANHKLIAKGEVVVIEENFGVRITDIISPVDRLTRLR
ncbi:MAG TPA: flagellar motor switch phosphatase FliY [Bacillota bacterium]|nr:flagellar motor switch phosphatase FliY [Bacillota bacterium]